MTRDFCPTTGPFFTFVFSLDDWPFYWSHCECAQGGGGTYTPRLISPHLASVARSLLRAGLLAGELKHVSLHSCAMCVTDLFCSYKSDPSMDTELTFAKSVFIFGSSFPPQTQIYLNSVVYFVDSCMISILHSWVSFNHLWLSSDANKMSVSKPRVIFKHTLPCNIS